MALFAGEPQNPIASEGISASVPPTLASTASVPLVTAGFRPLVSGTPQFATGHWQTYAPPDPVAESILMTATRVPEAPLTPLSQSYVPLNTSSAAATLTVGLQSLG